MTDFNPYQPPAQPLAPAAPIPAVPYGTKAGLGGWLVLVAFGLVFTPLRMLVEMGKLYKTLVTDGTWTVLTTPGSEQYHVLWAPFLVLEAAFNVSMCVAWCYAIFLFFSKNRRFPTWYIWAHAVTLVFLILDMFALQLVRPDLPLSDPDTTKEIARSLMNVVIWIPYMLVSKRVAATFVH